MRERLLSKGIDGDRLEAIGHGSDLPLDTNRTEQGRAHNRRIEFHIARLVGEASPPR